MLRQWQWFGEWSIGCVGILSDWVVETVNSVCRKGETTLTIDELKRHALKPDQRFRLETEARQGEFKIEQAKAKSEQELLQLLGKPHVLSSSPFSSPNAFDEQPPQSTASHSRSFKRIERAVHRDPVGTKEASTAPVETSKCSFLGPIGVTIQQFQESGIWHVECQNCGARRDMKKVKDRQKFPPHPPRKTPPPKGEERWVSREVGWKLVKD
jgi:hypothetical protein